MCKAAAGHACVEICLKQAALLIFSTIKSLVLCLEKTHCELQASSCTYSGPSSSGNCLLVLDRALN